MQKDKIVNAVLFDLDGVIVDTAKYHFQAWKNLAMMMGFEFSEKDNERLKGVSRMRSLEILLEVGGLTVDEPAKIELAEFKNNEYVGYISKMTPDELLPGVVDFINELKSKGIKCAIGSASKNTPLILERIGLSSFFDAVVDGNTVTEAKPNPEVFLKGAEKLGIRPDECLVFEDAEAGVRAAKAGGMFCIGVGSPDVLWMADAVIPGFEGYKLENALKQIRK